jgi:hypothetical protein
VLTTAEYSSRGLLPTRGAINAIEEVASERWEGVRTLDDRVGVGAHWAGEGRDRALARRVVGRGG